jgi:hypothetical protein
METHDSRDRALAPEAATQEPASPDNPEPMAAAGAGGPVGPPAQPPSPPPRAAAWCAEAEEWRFASDQAEDAFWAGVTHGIRSAGREVGHPHMPVDFSLDLTREGAAPGLVSNKLLEAWPVDANAPPPARAPRHDGWDPVKERRFIETLADTGVVADACRAAKMSRNAAYERRRSAAGRAFALAWDAAILISRGAVGDDVMSRSRHGVIDRVYRNGELVAERHRYDNRLTMAVLTRLDRLAEGLGENAPVVRAVAQEFDQFLDLLPRGVEGAEAFLAARFPAPLPDGKPVPVEEPPGVRGETPPSGSEQALLARLDAYRQFGVALPAEIDLGELDAVEMERWTGEQWERAEFSGFLEMVHESEWPEAARAEGPDDSNGMCKLRQLYLRYNPPGPVAEPPEAEDDFAGCGVWEDDEAPGGWATDFPPPAGFDGWEEGEPGEEDYKRELTEEELAAIGADAASEQAEREERLADQHAARRRFFELDEDGDDSSSPSRSDGEGDHPEGGGGVEDDEA